MILFTTPVYWWGMSAQLKLVIDKCYCRGLQLKNKKVGVIAVGGSPVDSIQYELINKQFDCMADYLSWDMLFRNHIMPVKKQILRKMKFIERTWRISEKTYDMKKRKTYNSCHHDNRCGVIVGRIYSKVC